MSLRVCVCCLNSNTFGVRWLACCHGCFYLKFAPKDQRRSEQYMFWLVKTTNYIQQCNSNRNIIIVYRCLKIHIGNQWSPVEPKASKYYYYNCITTSTVIVLLLSSCSVICYVSCYMLLVHCIFYFSLLQVTSVYANTLKRKQLQVSWQTWMQFLVSFNMSYEEYFLIHVHK